MMQRKNTYFEKDTVARDFPIGSITNNGPFSLHDGDIMSMMQQGNSELMAWLPSRGVTALNETVRHFSFVTMEGHTGAETYLDFLARQGDVDECDFGPKPAWNGMEYRSDFYKFSFSSKTFKYPDHFGISEWQMEPRQYVRGSLQGTSIASDLELGVSQMAYISEQHMNWNQYHGDPSIVPSRNPGASEGLDLILTPGWVNSKRVGSGESNMIDPIVRDGSALATTDGVEALRLIQIIVRKLRNRARAMGTSITGDMAIVMTAAHWAKISDAIACGNLATGNCASNFTLTSGDYFALKNSVVTGGLGNGFIPVDSIPVPVIIEDGLGSNIYGTPNQVQGDILILTRRLNGMNILENQYLDFSKLPVSLANGAITRTVLNNGFYSMGYKTENNTCFSYFIENWFRTVSRMQPLQAKISGVVIDVEDGLELIEGSNFTSDDFYAYGEGNQAGGGVDYIRQYGSY